MFRISQPLSFLLAVGTGALLFAGCHDHRRMDPHQRADKIVSQMKKGLDLTEDQTARVKQLAYEVADTMQAQMRGHMANGEGAFLAQLRAPIVDTAALAGQMRSQESDMQARMQGHRAFAIAEFVKLHDILTPDQREKLAAFLEKHREMMRDNMGHSGE